MATPPSWISEKCNFSYKWHSYFKCRSAHKIWWKSVQKWLRYTCLHTSKMAAVGHVEFIWTTLWTTQESRFVGNIFSDSGAMIRSDLLRYCDFQSLLMWLKNAYSRLFWEVFGGFDPKSGQISLRPPKGINGWKTRYFSYWALELLQKYDL